jgi:hypothetical protein
MVAAEVRAAPTFEVAELRPLFDASGFSLDGFHQSYEVLPGGKGFVFLRPHQAGQRAIGVTLVQAEHWLDDVRARTGR